jgi:tetratricopeptide (TPR) repeat protein
MNDDEELPDDIHEVVVELSELGNNAMDEEDYDQAISEWRTALALLPQPKSKWQAAMWLHASIGDALRAQSETAAALVEFQAAYGASDGQTNPFVLFSLGACHLDLGHDEEATEFLNKAYELEGEEIFEEEPEYLELLRKRKLLN